MHIPTTTRPPGGFSTSTMLALCLFSMAACKMPLITKDMVAAAKDPGGFGSTAGNRAVTLSWTADPTVASYSVYYTIDGGAPTEAYSEKLHDVKMSPSQAS